jgi:hypothetical protein
MQNDNRESDNTGLWQCFVANTHKKGPRLCELLPTAVAHLRTLRSVHETHRDEHRMRAVQAKGCALAEAFIAQRLIASVKEGQGLTLQLTGMSGPSGTQRQILDARRRRYSVAVS